MNANFTDVADGLTNALTRDGQAGMTAPFRASSGTVSQPGISFSAEDTTGLYRIALNIIGFAIGGIEAFRFTSNGLTGKGATPIGSGMDYWGDTAPDGWLFAYGQQVSQTTYAALFAIFGTKYNTGGEAGGNFRMPDLRGRTTFVNDGLGGTPANRLTLSATGGINGDTLGNTGGEQAHGLVSAENGPHVHTANVTDPGHVHANGNAASNAIVVNSGVAQSVATQTSANTSSNTTGISVSIVSSGSGTAHNTVPPGIVCNYIIFAGV